VTRHLTPAIGSVPLHRLTPQHIARMLADLSARGDLSPSTVRYLYAVLRIALGRAEKSGRVGRNVARLVDPPRQATPEMRALTVDEVGRFLPALEGYRVGPLVTVAVTTGMRQGELLGLRWPDVDLEGGMVTVSSATRPWTAQGGRA
jgi:integrase